jgi:sulfatase maturation enzyme AslB (radical SAM superfamily)
MNIFKKFLRHKNPPTKNEPFCVMPWTNLTTDTNGKCKICCIVMKNKYIQTDDGKDAEIHKHSLESIWNSRYLRSVRKQMLKNEWPEDCWYCEGQEAQNLESQRLSVNKLWMNEDVKKRVEHSKKNDGHVAQPPSSLEPRPGTLCNLKCVMCWSMSSSKLYSERKAYLETEGGSSFLKSSWAYEVAEVEQSDLSWPESEQYGKTFEECAPHLKRIYFTGGEPLLIKNNFSKLEYLIDRGYTDVLVSLTTNLTIWNKKYLDILSKFQKVELTVSIDAYGDTNSYVRSLSEWEKVEQNFNRYLKEYPHFSPSIICTVQNITVFGVLDLFRWLSKLSPDAPFNVCLTELQNPKYMQPRVLPANIKEKFAREVAQFLSDPVAATFYHTHANSILQWVETPCQELKELSQQLREHVHFIETKGKIPLQKIFPDLHEYLFEGNRTQKMNKNQYSIL